ncbi:hypothetical protein CL657_01155 [bacterium]|nr:hypothetical protein [bacterium]|tara:strand:+ start:217 stop:405 length:189 start_codon:yes stop_codon:yes gene_type:complete
MVTEKVVNFTTGFFSTRRSEPTNHRESQDDIYSPYLGGFSLNPADPYLRDQNSNESHYVVIK